MADLQRTIEACEARLDHFDIRIRRENLEYLKEFVKNGDIVPAPEKEIANLHCHTFFSYNGYGYSPTHLAWLGKKNGLKFMGIIDFDVLDGVDEFLEACESLELRGSAGIETRVFIPQFCEREINSPGEPGVYYDMGIGFTSSATPKTAKAQMDDIRERVRQRNCRVLESVNAFLDPLQMDYEKDILPLTPSGNATERHMVAAIVQKSYDMFDDPVLFWSEKLGQSQEEINAGLDDLETFKNIVRKKLMKRGGVGYIKPTAETFPRADEFHQMVRACQAMPCAAWLDGTTRGEQDIEELLTLLIEKGTAAINIIPDRNWNISDPKIKQEKVKNLYHIVELAKKLDLPILVGTEMNSFGQKFMDDFTAPELKPLTGAFINGAWFIYGHTWLQKRWEMGYQSRWAEQYFTDRKSRNDFYISAGKVLPPKISDPALISEINESQAPEEVLLKLAMIKEHEQSE